MIHYIAIGIILLTLFFSTIRCLVIHNVLDKASKFIALYLLVTFLTETSAIIGTIYFRYNIAIYNSYSLIQFILLSYYFFTINKNLIPSNYQKAITVIGVIFYIANHLLLQDFVHEPNSNFLAFESVVMVGFILLSYYNQLNEKSAKSTLTIHFWICAILLTFWSFTLIIWLIGYSITELSIKIHLLLNYLMYTINIITYTGFGLVFLFYKKLQPVE